MACLAEVLPLAGLAPSSPYSGRVNSEEESREVIVQTRRGAATSPSLAGTCEECATAPPTAATRDARVDSHCDGSA